MFIVKVDGGFYHGQTILSDGWIPFFSDPKDLLKHFGIVIAKFEDLADAQDFIIDRDSRVRRGDYGIGASLVIEETDGDIKYERH